MRLHIFGLITLCLAFGVACDDGGGSATPDLNDPKAGVASTQLTAPENAQFSEGALQLIVEDSIALNLVAVLEDGSTQSGTEAATWSSSDSSVLELTGPGAFTALKAGEVEIIATLGEQTATMPVAIAPIAVESLTVSPSEEQVLSIGESVQLTVTATLVNGKEEDVTERAEWTSSNLDVVDVDGGLVTLLSAGGGEITATVDDVSVSVFVKADCAYPENAPASSDNGLQVGSVIPNLTWNGAFGNNKNVDFSLEDIYCGAQGFENVSSITFILTAGWCPACKEFIPAFNNEFHNRITQSGSVVIYVETETDTYGPATHAYANDDITRLIGPKNGLRVGDAQTTPTQDFFRTSPTITAMPTQMVVRTSDMQIIASSAQTPSLLPFAELAADPEGDWSHLLPTPNCGPEDEEPTEPNNDPATAGMISAGSFEGGVCDGQPDFFQINEEGSYDVVLEFNHGEADLDMAIWPAGSDPQNDQPTAVSDGTGNQEQVSFTGPSLVVVYSYSPAFSTSYRLSVTPN
ncbi:MAG: Ig-like domain-containing protein [Bradymonadia bacterium]